MKHANLFEHERAVDSSLHPQFSKTLLIMQFNRAIVAQVAES
jgi:hypothetical protein